MSDRIVLELARRPAHRPWPMRGRVLDRACAREREVGLTSCIEFETRSKTMWYDSTADVVRRGRVYLAFGELSTYMAREMMVLGRWMPVPMDLTTQSLIASMTRFL